MNWILKPWSALTTDELYELLALRAEVFVVEQSCPFQDLDGVDRRDGVLHLLGYEGDHLAAYARIMAPGIGDDSGAAIKSAVRNCEETEPSIFTLPPFRPVLRIASGG